MRPCNNTRQRTLVIRRSKLPARGRNLLLKTCKAFAAETTDLPSDCSLISATRIIKRGEDPVALGEIKEVVLVGIT